MPRRRKFFTRRRVIALALLVLFASFAAGGYWVYTRGKKRTDLYDQAASAIRAEQMTKAESILLKLIEADDKDLKARMLLIRVYRIERRHEDAERIAKEWLALGRDPIAATAVLSEIALDQGHFREAEALARGIADQAPSYALRTIIAVQDAYGSFDSRWNAHRAALNLAAITDRPGRRASYLLFAASTMRDLSEIAPGWRPLTRSREHSYLAEARAAIEQGRERGMSESEARRLDARVNLMDKEQWKRRDARDVLLEMQEDGATTPGDTLALAWHYTVEGDADAAQEQILSLEGQPVFDWFRAVRRLARYGHTDAVVTLLDQKDVKLDPSYAPVVIVRAQALLAGTAAQRQEGVGLIMSLLERDDVADAHLAGAYRVLAGDKALASSAAQFLDRLGSLAEDARLLAGALQAGPGRVAPQDVDRVASAVRSFREGITVLQILARDGEASALAFLESQIDAGGEDEPRYRLVRAMYLAGLADKASGEDEQASLRREALEDLRAMGVSAALKSDLVSAFRLAFLMGEHGLSGQLAATAIPQSGLPENFATLVAVSLGEQKDQEVRAAFAQGMRTGAAGSELLGVLADAIAGPNYASTTLRPAVDDLAVRRDASKATLILASDLAAGANDVDVMLRYSRRLHAMEPDSAYGKLSLLRALGAGAQAAAKTLANLAILEEQDALTVEQEAEKAKALKERDAADEEILALPVTKDDIFDVAAYRVDALLRTQREDDCALFLREYLAAHPGESRAYSALATLHERAGHDDRALGVLSIAPATRDILTQQARLLSVSGDQRLAEQVMLLVVSRWPEHFSAWRSLSVLLLDQHRASELVAILTTALEADVVKAEPAQLRSLIHSLRASALEREHEYQRALDDYIAAVRLLPENVTALNNGAWLMVSSDLGDSSTAESWIEAALELAPGLPQIWHTAHVVAVDLGDLRLGLDRLDEAISRVESPRLKYLWDRVDLLRRLGEKDKAIEQLDEIFATEFTEPEDPEGAEEHREILAAARALRGDLRGSGSGN